jgi:hypothetical protein
LSVTKSFNYLAKFKQTSAILLFFKFCCGKYIFDFEEIDKVESSYIEKLRNGALIYCDKEHKFETIKSYDRNHYYQYILGNKKSKFQIPTKHGKEYVLSELPDDLKFGYYKAKITSKYESINKLFVFNDKLNWYHYYDIKFLLKHKKLLKAKIELIDDEKPNAYLYKWADVIYSNEVFTEWYDMIEKIKAVNPKNGLAKSLGSMCWGVISGHRQFSITEEELQNDFEKYKDSKSFED